MKTTSCHECELRLTLAHDSQLLPHSGWAHSAAWCWLGLAAILNSFGSDLFLRKFQSNPCSRSQDILLTEKQMAKTLSPFALRSGGWSSCPIRNKDCPAPPHSTLWLSWCLHSSSVRLLSGHTLADMRPITSVCNVQLDLKQNSQHLQGGCFSGIRQKMIQQ